MMQICLRLLPTILLLAIFSTAQAANFTFSYGSASQCDNFAVSWTGGTPPYQLVVTPLFGTPRTLQIPSSSYNNGQGSYGAPLPFPNGQKFIASMSDASGWGSGGVTDVITVGPSVSNTNCNTTDPGVDFFFELNTALTQCRPYTFSGYSAAVQPLTIIGVIPGGQSFILNPPTGSTSFDWVADVAAGTSIIWIMYDSQGRNGGSSDAKVVGVSDDSTCLVSNSPSSVSVIPSQTSSGASSSQTGSQSGTSSSGSSTPTSPSGKSGTAKSGISGGVVAGAVGATLVAVVAVGALVLFCIRRRRRNRGAFYYEGGGYNRKSRFGNVDLMQEPLPADDPAVPPPEPYSYTTPASSYGSNSQRVPYAPSTQNLLDGQGSAYGQGSQYGNGSRYNRTSIGPEAYPMEPTYSASSPTHSRGAFPQDGGSSSDGRSTFQDGSMTSSARKKAAKAGAQNYNKPTRFIVHTDLEEVVPDDEEEEVVELPPQYSEARAPMPQLSQQTELHIPTLPPPPPSPTRATDLPYR